MALNLGTIVLQPRDKKEVTVMSCVAGGFVVLMGLFIYFFVMRRFPENNKQLGQLSVQLEEDRKTAKELPKLQEQERAAKAPKHAALSVGAAARISACEAMQ